MLWLLTCVTTVVLLIIVVMIRDMARLPTATTTTALSTSASAAPSGKSGPTRDEIVPKRATPSPSRSVSRPQVTDTASGLSYDLLPSPWGRGCPAVLDSPMFSWDAGEHAVAGQADIGGTLVDWHGNACSGQLQQAFAYSGPGDLTPVATGVADAVGQAYYAGLPHSRTVEDSYGTTVSGHAAWVVRFLMTYPDAASQGLAWSSELGAVVVVDKGAGQAPAVFYVSVPSNLGTANVATLISSLRLA